LHGNFIGDEEIRSLMAGLSSNKGELVLMSGLDCHLCFHNSTLVLTDKSIYVQIAIPEKTYVLVFP